MTYIHAPYTLLIVVDMKEVFDLFDFWDGRDGLIDAVKVGDLLRCCGLNPTNALIYKNGGTKKSGNPRTAVHGGCWAKDTFLSLIQWSIPYMLTCCQYIF